MPPGLFDGGYGPLLTPDGKPRIITAHYALPSTEDPAPDPVPPKETP